MADASRILLVDDVPANIDVLTGILADDYELMAATDGRRALELAKGSSPPDLILLDVMMPGMDGFEVCRRLKRDGATSDIPVVFVTAMDDPVDEARGFEAGGLDYVTKPVSPPVVRARVETHLSLHNQSQHLRLLVRERTSELKATRLRIIERLGRAAEYKDDETGKHVIRMAQYTGLVAVEYGLAPYVVDLLTQAAPMHDVGKIGVPDAILQKPGKLDAAEWEVMQQHTTIGAEIIGETEHRLLHTAREMALTHHEKWDGSGYPRGLAGEDIPVSGRVSGVADVFDALTSARPYKQPWPVERAVDLIESESGKHFEPDVVEAFMAALPAILEVGQLLNPALADVA